MTELRSLGDCRLYVSQIIDSLNDLAHVFEADTETMVNYAQRHFKSLHRQWEWLTVRAMLRFVSGNQTKISYTAEGQPVLDNSELSISISHSKTHAAILLSESTHIGVDIEQVGPRILKLQNRIASANELPRGFEHTDCRQQATYLTALWTAKEAVYKEGYSSEKFDMLSDVEMAPFSIGSLPLTLQVADKRYNYVSNIFIQEFCGNIIAVAKRL